MATKSSRRKTPSKARAKSAAAKSVARKKTAVRVKGKAVGKPRFAKAKSSAINKRKKPAAKSVKKVVKQSLKSPAKLAKPVAKAAAPESALLQVVRRALDDMKAVNVKVIDVTGKSDVADTMVIASGNSDRHVKSIADRAVEFAKQAGYRPMGVEGGRDGEWVLVDLQDVIVHVMLPRVREFYRLEDLWDIAAASRAEGSVEDGE
jgi:ribosome-associated protein